MEAPARGPGARGRLEHRGPPNRLARPPGTQIVVRAAEPGSAASASAQFMFVERNFPGSKESPMRMVLAISAAVVVSLGLPSLPAHADATYQPLPFSQD